MTSRDRQLAAIRHEVPDRISVDTLAIENLAEVAEALGVGEAEVYEALGIDGRIVAAAYTGELSCDSQGQPLSAWGTTDTGDYGTSRAYPLACADTVADVRRHPWPDLTCADFEGAAQQAARLGREYAVRGPYWMPLFCQVCNLFGMEEAMARMALQVAVFEAALEEVFQRVAAYCERLLDTCGEAMHIFCLGDDFATQRGMMISPEHFRRLLKPRYAALFELGKRRGKPVWFHSCGDITAVLPDLIEIGMDVWETVQLHALPMSATELKREYGRHLTFSGGISTQSLPFADPGQVSAEVERRILELGAGGGYICGPDHHIKPDVPAQNVLALYGTSTRFRAAGYTTLAPAIGRG